MGQTSSKSTLEDIKFDAIPGHVSKCPVNSKHVVKMVDNKNDESWREREHLVDTEKECQNLDLLNPKWTEDFKDMNSRWKEMIQQRLDAMNYSQLNTIHVFLFQLCDGNLEEYHRKRNNNI